MLINQSKLLTKAIFTQNFRILLRPLAAAFLSIALTACGGGSGGGGSSGSSSSGATTLSMTADPSRVESGQTATITWLAQNSVSCRAEDSSWTSSIETGGSATVGPMTRNTDFTMSCLDKEGRPVTETTTITVNDSPTPPRPSLSLTADDTTINQGEGDSTTLRWTSNNSNSCNAAKGWTSSTATRGNQRITSIPTTTTYTMTCTGTGGTTTRSVTVNVNTVRMTPAPTLNLAADDAKVDENGSTTIRWTSGNTATCAAIGGWTDNTDPNGSQQVGPLSTSRDFRITCTGVGGGISKSVRVTVEPNTSVETAELSWTPPATNENGTSLTDLAGYSIHYGTTQANLNQIITINNPGVSSYVVENLTESIYYFAVKAFDSSGNDSNASGIVSKTAQ